MAFEIIETEASKNDLEEIIDYIATVLENRSAATALLDDIDKCFDDMENTPLMYKLCNDPYLASLGYRKVFIHKYVMVYQVDEGKKKVFIMRYFHGSQDYEKSI